MKKPAIICDLDGTLCIFNGRGPFDEDKAGSDLPNMAVLNTITAMASHGYTIIFTSGRHESARDVTTNWLAQYGAPIGSPLYMRPNAVRGTSEEKDSIVKERIYRERIEPFYDVLYVLDDRQQVVDMWRAIGLTCFQVAIGNF